MLENIANAKSAIEFNTSPEAKEARHAAESFISEVTKDQFGGDGPLKSGKDSNDALKAPGEVAAAGSALKKDSQVTGYDHGRLSNSKDLPTTGSGTTYIELPSIFQ